MKNKLTFYCFCCVFFFLASCNTSKDVVQEQEDVVKKTTVTKPKSANFALDMDALEAQVIKTLESRVGISEEQKSQISAIAEDIGFKVFEDRADMAAHRKMMTERIRAEVLTAEQMGKFKAGKKK